LGEDRARSAFGQPMNRLSFAILLENPMTTKSPNLDARFLRRMDGEKWSSRLLMHYRLGFG
jgi:hypothetical protein